MSTAPLFATAVPATFTLPTASTITFPFRETTEPFTAVYSPDTNSTSPSVASIDPSTWTLPAIVALTDLPCKSLPDATDICLLFTTTPGPDLAAVLNTISPSALTAPLTFIFPSETTVKSPPTSSRPSGFSPVSNVTLISESTSANSSMEMLTVPPETSSTLALPPAAPTLKSPSNAAPSATLTCLPSSATLPLKDVPDPTVTFPPARPKLAARTSQTAFSGSRR